MKHLLLVAALAPPLVLSAQEGNPTRINLVNWATGLSRPIFATHAGDDRLFVSEQGGAIKIVTDSMQVVSTPFMTLDSVVCCGEQGFLGFAFDPDYADNGFFYTYYIFDDGTDEGVSRISRFQVTADPNIADPTTEVVIYSYPQPYTNHNGGALLFGPDGYLYFGFGDGGLGNDPQGHGQDLSEPLGDMIRIDVSAHDNGFLIPPDNPWVDAQDTLPEIWASGLRNPWRWSFDRLTGDMWIGDVGQGAWEETDFWPAGDNSGPNFGWRCREGLVATPGVSQAGCGAAADYVSPVAVFNHTSQSWSAIVGGYVYRGSQFPHLYGKYMTTDNGAGDFITFGPGFDLDTLLMTTNQGYASFGEDLAGEIYVMDVSHGTVKKIHDACPMEPPVIEYDGSVISSSEADSYQWFGNGVLITGATGQTYTPTVAGDYYVVGNFGAPCTLRSTTLNILSTSITSSEEVKAVVFPQPARDQLIVQRATATAIGRVELLDIAGRSVRRMTWIGGDRLTMDVSDLENGAYVLQLIDAAGGKATAIPVSVAH